MIFVDTSAWFAGIVPTDADHEIAAEWFRSNDELLITSDYVIDETLTLFRARGERSRALAIADEFFSGGLTEILYLTEEEIRESVSMFKRFVDKDWSFTDCTSKYLCERYQIKKAISFDKHFRQFGSVEVVI